MDNGSNHPRVLRQCLSVALCFLLVGACSPENTELGDVGLAAEAATTPRDVYSNPDLNGIWQAMGSAHRDIEAHAVREGRSTRGEGGTDRSQPSSASGRSMGVAALFAQTP